jgi:hypothetical protein
MERVVQDYRNAAEYGMYLSAIATIVQSGVSSLKRLQQG